MADVQVAGSPKAGMIPKRLASTIATGLWVAGALLVGNALHVSVVTGEVPITHPAPVFYAVGGIALILVAQNLDVHPSEYIDSMSTNEEEVDEGPEEESFDQSASPLDDEALESLDERERSDGGQRGSENRQD